VEAAQAHVAAANPELLAGAAPPLDMRVLNVLAGGWWEGWGKWEAGVCRLGQLELCKA
jgi:hypothetical protein